MFLKSIDDFILNRFEQVTHKLQRMFGITSVHCCRVCVLLSAALFIRSLAVLQHEIHKWAWPLILLSLASNYLWVGRNQRINTDAIFVNNERENARWLRLIMIAFLPAFLWLDWRDGDVWFEVYTVAQYFAAVTDLPVMPSRLSQWLGSFNTSEAGAVANE